MKETPFHERTRRLNRMQMWFNWDQHIVPDVYTDFHEELRTTRAAVSMGDMSPLSKYEIRGDHALQLLDRVVTRDVTKLQIGQVFYTPWTDERGKVVGDGLLFRTGENAFRLSADPQLEWLTRHAGGFDVAVDEVTDDYGLLAIQGPLSPRVMDALTGELWEEMPFSHARTTTVAGADLLAARQGFTGEVGYELWVPADAGVDVWDAVAKAGEAFGIRPVGELAIDVARVEAGMLIVGADYTGAGPDRPGSVIELNAEHEASPAELGLGGFVELDKGDLVGKEALAAEAAAEVPRLRLVGLELDRQAVVRLYAAEGLPPMLPSRVWWYPVPASLGGRPVGHATSVTWAPTVGKIVGFGHLERSQTTPGTEVAIRWTLNGADGEVPARVVELPFLELRRGG